MASAGSMISTSPQTLSLKEDLLVTVDEIYHPYTTDAPSVEDWINKEFGEMEGSQLHHEKDLIYMAFRTQVDEYIDMAEFVDVAPSMLHEEQAALFFVPLDEGLFYEPELWCFS